MLLGRRFAVVLAEVEAVVADLEQQGSVGQTAFLAVLGCSSF